MTFETLNNNIMLVELSLEDMKKLQITYENLTNQNYEAKIAIRKLLDQIDRKNHIRNGGKVIVEALPIDGGGCFFIFTFTNIQKRYKLKKNESVSFYLLKSLDDLLDFICVIRKTLKSEKSVVAYTMEKNYYVSIPGDKKMKMLLSEFGTEVDGVTGDRVLEYGKNLGRIYLQ